MQVELQTEEAGPCLYYCWKRGSNPNQLVPTVQAKDAIDASEKLISTIRASTPWPPWVAARNGIHAPAGMIPETRVCIDCDGGEYLVGEVDSGPEATHMEIWRSFGPEEHAAFQRLWKAMHRGPSEEWF